MMYVNHSRDHEGNIHKCSECMWHFSTLDRLHRHLQDSHDTMYHACGLCGDNFPNNHDLSKHMTGRHINICHICRKTFLSEELLLDYLSEAHPGTAVRSQENMADDKRAEEHQAKEWHKQEIKKRKKEKKKKKRRKEDWYDDDDDDDDDDDTYHPSEDHGD